jgi:hypothetical protein
MGDAERIVQAVLPAGADFGAITPDDKDWTWVLQQRCAECGFDPDNVTGPDVPALLGDAAARFAAVLLRPDIRERPDPAAWSPLEYVCHVRDVNTVITQRAKTMLTEDDPTFQNWDQDVTAVVERYAEQDPVQVAIELADAAKLAAEVFADVGAAQWSRPGRRSNGSVFTVESLGQYFVHDLVHHLHDLSA